MCLDPSYLFGMFTYVVHVWWINSDIKANASLKKDLEIHNFDFILN